MWLICKEKNKINVFKKNGEKKKERERKHKDEFKKKKKNCSKL
jgi:hypothetical protein